MSGPQSSHHYESEVAKIFGPHQAPQTSNEENMDHLFLRHPNAPSLKLMRKLKVRRFKPPTWPIYAEYLASRTKRKDTSTAKKENADEHQDEVLDPLEWTPAETEAFVRLVQDISKSVQDLQLEDEPCEAAYFVCEEELSSPPVQAYPSPPGYPSPPEYPSPPDDGPSRQPSDNIWQQSNPSNRPTPCWPLREPDFPNRGDHQ